MVRFKVSVPSALPGLVSGSRSRASAFLTGQPGADSRCEGRQTSQEGTVKLAASTLKGVHRAAIHFQNAGCISPIAVHAIATRNAGELSSSTNHAVDCL